MKVKTKHIYFFIYF